MAEKEKKKKRGNRGLTGIILVIILVVGLFLALISFITDLLWFFEIGYQTVFLTKLFTQLKIGIPTFVILGALSYLYLMAIKKGYNKKFESQPVDAGAAKKLNLIALGLAAIFAGLATYYVASQGWFEVLKFANSTDFNISDPLFNLDISFYVFKLALIKLLNTIVIGAIIGFAALTVIYYMLMMSFKKPVLYAAPAYSGDDENEDDDEDDDDEDEDDFDGDFRGGQRNNQKGGAFGSNPNDILGKVIQAFFGTGGNQGSQSARRPQQKSPIQLDNDSLKQLLGIASKQITVLGVLFFLMLGVNFFLKQFDLLYSSTGVLYGAGFTDVNVTLWMFRALVVLSVAGAVGFVIGLKKKKFRSMLTIPVIMIAVGAIGMGGAWLVQNYFVSPDEINKESKYLARNIAFTQSAYGINNVSERAFPVANNLTQDDIANNTETISNIRINDYDPVKRFYNNVQTIRPYYTFTDVFVDRYMINNEYTQVYISAREIDDSSQTTIPQTFLNKHIKYTHGYGITLSRVDKITASGQPDMLIRNIPPASQVEEIDITRPEIYFGKMTHDYILIRTTEKEFDYPTDDEQNAETIYEGAAGIKMNFINKLMFSIRERNLRILVSGALTDESKIMINRNISQRVNTIMPRLQYDTDPYMVTVDGRLFWIIDAYTTSTYYPYSEPFNRETGTNYIRNSVKVVIDAYNGTTNYYIVDDKDPIAATYKKIFPALYKSLNDMNSMADGLQKHIRYPNTMLNIQANVFQRYHMSDVVMFYQNEDLWDIANEIYERVQNRMKPNYYIMKLPGESSAEFVNTIPYTPREKLNMTALLLARNDVPNYGELVLFRLPKGKIVYGPMQIEAQIDQHPEISKEFSLCNSSGSTYTRGNMFVVPIEDSLLYVEPVYLEAENSSIPEVKRVIVAYGDAIAYQPTLAGALEELFGKPEEGTKPGDKPEGPVTPPEGPTAPGTHTTAELINLADEAFINMETAQRNGDWAAYGRYLDQLESYLSELKTLN